MLYKVLGCSSNSSVVGLHNYTMSPGSWLAGHCLEHNSCHGSHVRVFQALSCLRFSPLPSTMSKLTGPMTELTRRHLRPLVARGHHSYEGGKRPKRSDFCSLLGPEGAGDGDGFCWPRSSFWTVRGARNRFRIAGSGGRSGSSSTAAPNAKRQPSASGVLATAVRGQLA